MRQRHDDAHTPWPNLPAELHPVALDAVVGPLPSQYIDKLRNCRVFVKYGVGYDDADIQRFGKLGIPVCDVPD